MDNKLMLIVSGVLCVCLIAFGVIIFMMWTKISTLSSQTIDAETLTAEEAEAEEADVEEKLGPIYSLDSFIVNLNNPAYRKYLRVTMDLEVGEEEDLDKIIERLPQIRDRVLTILPNKQFEDIISAEGKTVLREEILTALNSFFNTEVVSNVYFTEFVIQ